MIKNVVMGIIFLTIFLSLEITAEATPTKAIEFIRLLNDVEIYYLKGDYPSAKADLDKAYRILEKEKTEVEELLGEAWHIIKKWQGSDRKTTEPFQITGKTWRVKWKNLGNLLIVNVLRPGEEFPVATPVNTLEQGKDVSYIYEAGEFYLDINAIGDWSIEIEEKYQE